MNTSIISRDYDAEGYAGLEWALSCVPSPWWVKNPEIQTIDFSNSEEDIRLNLKLK
ncbi:MAG: hypothetical protein AAFY76_15775 [Cyanobacteria bacterium J06649_11]